MQALADEFGNGGSKAASASEDTLRTKGQSKNENDPQDSLEKELTDRPVEETERAGFEPAVPGIPGTRV